MTIKSLQFFESPPISNSDPKRLVIFLHGYGSNGKDLLSLSHEFCKIIPDAHFISPNAPYRLDGQFYDGYQWFSLSNYDPTVLRPQIIEANDILDEFILQQLERFKLCKEQLTLVGFSQGSMMAMYNSMRSKEKIKGVLSYSGKLILPTSLGEQISSKPEVCLIHGKDDYVLPFQNFLEAENLLKKIQVPFESHALEGLDHTIDQRGIKIGKNFLLKN